MHGVKFTVRGLLVYHRHTARAVACRPPPSAACAAAPVAVGEQVLATLEASAAPPMGPQPA
jgi:hypothetical protein